MSQLIFERGTQGHRGRGAAKASGSCVYFKNKTAG